MVSKVILLLGSNIGNKVAYLKLAYNEINLKVGKIINASSLYESAAWGETDQASFMNQVLVVETSLVPFKVLEITQAIEQKAGRIARGRWKERELDIDILFYNDEIIDEKFLKIPHPYIHERLFTLVPLIEILPDFIHPSLNKSLATLHADCDKTLIVKKYEV